jgi:hypothetical protein
VANDNFNWVPIYEGADWNWASQDEIDERFRSETQPLVYCDQLEQDKRRMSKVLGLVNAASVTLCFNLREAVAGTDRLFQKKT